MSTLPTEMYLCTWECTVEGTNRHATSRKGGSFISTLVCPYMASVGFFLIFKAFHFSCTQCLSVLQNEQNTDFTTPKF